MKILQVNSLFAPRRYGGAEIFLERLSGELTRRGNQVLVACLSPEPTSHDEGNLRVQEFSLRNIYWPFDGAQPGRLRKMVWHLRNSFGRSGAADIAGLIQQEKPDLVHTHNLFGFTSAVWERIRSLGVPLVHTIHDYGLLCPSTTMFRRDTNCDGQCLGCRFFSLPKPAHSRCVNAVVGCSRFVLERHTSNGYFSEATQHVIHNGDPRDGVHPVRSPESETSSDPGASTATRPLRVGYLGRLSHSKGVEFMLSALGAPVMPGCELIVAGSGDSEFESRLKGRFEPQGVRFVGRVDGAAFLANVDVLVVPSLWHEPFGLVLCEAMSAGVPVIASNVGGIPEIIEHGRFGFLFEPGNAETLRQHVSRLANDPQLREQMSQACLRQADRHRFENTVESYLRVYDQTMSARSLN